MNKRIHLTVHSGVWPPGVVPSPELPAVEFSTLLGSVVSGVGGAVPSVAKFVGPGGALAELPSKCRSAERNTYKCNENHTFQFVSNSIFTISIRIDVFSHDLQKERVKLY